MRLTFAADHPSGDLHSFASRAAVHSFNCGKRWDSFDIPSWSARGWTKESDHRFRAHSFARQGERKLLSRMSLIMSRPGSFKPVILIRQMLIAIDGVRYRYCWRWIAAGYHRTGCVLLASVIDLLYPCAVCLKICE